jgi:hypothetical protein
LCKVIEDVEKRTTFKEKKIMQNNRNRVPMKVMKAYVVRRLSIEVARTLPE